MENVIQGRFELMETVSEREREIERERERERENENENKSERERMKERESMTGKRDNEIQKKKN
jgi:hypothetical protein